jgi:hypothetical protein
VVSGAADGDRGQHLVAEPARPHDDVLRAGGVDDRAQHRARQALAAARSANACLAEGPSLAVGLSVAQIRAIAIDLLRALGAERLDASAHVRAATPG